MNPHVVGAGGGFVPYIVVALAVSYISESADDSFWKILGLLIAARLFFTVIEAIGAALLWNVYGRRSAIEGVVKSLRAERMPKREHEWHDFGNYVASLQMRDDVSQHQKDFARETLAMASGVEKVTFMVGARLNEALDKGLARYSEQ